MQLELHQLVLRYAGLRVVDPDRQARLATSLGREGQHSAVLVVEDEGSDQLVLIDGYRRVDALRSLGRDLVEAVVLSMSPVEALLLSWQLGASPRRSVLEDAWLLQELVDTHGLRQTELALRLRRSKSWVSQRLALVGVLSNAAQDAVRTGILPPHGATKFLVPWARAHADHADRLVAGLGAIAVTDRQLERLYLAWRTADDDRRERIADQPHLFLKVEEALTEPALEPDDIDKLADELDGISGLCRKVRRRLRDGVFARANPEGRTRATRSWDEARLAFEGVRALMSKV